MIVIVELDIARFKYGMGEDLAL